MHVVLGAVTKDIKEKRQRCTCALRSNYFILSSLTPKTLVDICHCWTHDVSQKRESVNDL